MNNKPIHILIIEDDPEYAYLIREMVLATWKAPLNLACADRLSAGLECLVRESIDLILLDLSLPYSWGFETFARVHAQAPDIPIIVLTNIVDKTLAVQTIQAGAHDYLVKERVDGNALVQAIRRAIARQQEKSEKCPGYSTQTVHLDQSFPSPSGDNGQEHV